MTPPPLARQERRLVRDGPGHLGRAGPSHDRRSRGDGVSPSEAFVPAERGAPVGSRGRRNVSLLAAGKASSAPGFVGGIAAGASKVEASVAGYRG